MPQPAPLTTIVTAARDGSAEAFAELVARFQDMAVGLAFGQLGDAELARDAAQESFTEAFLHLDQLRDPAAFPGWFRRIVTKHCDRIRRKRGAALAPLATVAEPADDAAAPAEALERGADGRAVWRAIEVLPGHERTTVALFYLGGRSHREVAAFLEIPVGTVKKRLHSARQRLREEIEQAMTEEFDRVRPSSDPEFARVVGLFIAVRTGDRAGVAGLLDVDPTLVHRVEDWQPEQAQQLGAPVAERATALIRAAERDDVAMVDLLIDRGALVGEDCRCQTQESPLWAAVVTGSHAAAQRLLERGADPNAAARNGLAPLHVAAIRGLPQMVALLRAFGADPGLGDHRGRTPRDWAESKNDAAVLTALGAEGATQARAPVAGERRNERVWATGIKAIDLFAPLASGARVQCLGRNGVGRMVLVGELTERALKRGPVVWGISAEHDWEVSAIDQLRNEAGLTDRVRMEWARPGDPEPARRDLAQRTVAEANRLGREDGKPATVVIIEEDGYRAALESALPDLGPDTLCLVVPPWQHVDDSRPGSPPPPFDAQIGFDRALAEAHLFPAIDVWGSNSRALRPEVAGEEHCRLAREARDLLARYRERDPHLERSDPPDQPLAEQRWMRRAQQLLAFLTQPFLTTESFVSALGAEPSLENTLAGVRSILAGECDTMEIVHFYYKGDLAEIHAASAG